MPYEWPHYDATLQALIHPEQRHPYGLYSAGDGWPFDAICAELARLAYLRFEAGDEARLAEALRNAGFSEPACFTSGPPASGGYWGRVRNWIAPPDAQAIAATSSDGTVTIIAFRGSQPDSRGDVIIDAGALRVGWPGAGKVHRGFWRAYDSIRGPIDEWLSSARPRRLVVTGHSLGAAMATLMAGLHADAELITFGSPVVGNREFAESFAGRSARRYLDCSDVVSTVPPAIVGYVHVGELIYIDRHGVVHRPAPPAEQRKQDREEADELYEAEHQRLGNAPYRRYADHAPVNYVSAVAGKRR